jgi:hypothetical protein
LDSDKAKTVLENGFVKIIYKKMVRASLFLVLSGLMFGQQVVLAEPQFGGDVSGVVACTCGDNAGGHYFIVSDPHGNENGGSEAYVSGPYTDVRDCPPIMDGEEILGMHNENDEECKVRIGNACVLVGTGKGVDMYGTSPNDCGSHKTSASSSVVDDIIDRRNNGDKVTGSGTINSPEATNKSKDVVAEVKRKRDAGKRIESSEDINNPEATDLSESVVRDIVQKRDEGKEVRGSNSDSILESAGVQIGSAGGVKTLGKRSFKKKVVKKNGSLNQEFNKKTKIAKKQNQSNKMVLGTGFFLLFIGGAGYFILKAIKSVFIYGQGAK